MNKKLSAALTLVFFAAAAIVCVVILGSGGKYEPPSDISGSYAEEAIDAACRKGYMSTFEGKDGETLFYPESYVSRSEFCKVLVSYFGIVPELYSRDKLDYNDANDISKVYAPYVRAACAKNLIPLYRNELFLPDAPVTREEAAYMLGRLIDAKVSTDKSSKFSDYKDTDSLYAAKTDIVLAFGIMIGYPDGTLKPKNPLSRQELALMLARLTECEKIIKYT